MKLLIPLGTLCLGFIGHAALAADGDLDPAFSNDGQAVVTWPYSISGARVAVAADGSLFHVVTEARDTGEINQDFAISKLRPDGTLDPTFGFFGQRTVGFDIVTDGIDRVLGVFPLADGGVLLAGTAQTDVDSASYRPPGLIRLTASGDADPTFGDNGRRVIGGKPWMDSVGFDWNAVVRQPDGKLVFAGDCFNCEGARLAVALRVTENGDIDATFGDGGWFSLETEHSIKIGAVAVDPWNRILLGGSTETDADPDDRPWLARTTPEGDLDLTFGMLSGYSFLADVPSAGGDWYTTSIAIDSDGSIVLALSNSGAGIARTVSDGSLDNSFADGGFLDLIRENGADIRAVAIRGDHRIMAAGGINHTGGDYDNYIARVLPDGTLDPTFDSNGLVRVNVIAGANDSASAMAFAAGRPVVAGRGGADLDTGTLLRFESDLIFANGCGD